MAAKGTESEKAPGAGHGAGEAKGEAASSSGLKAWLPLIANVVLMPVLAYVMATRFLAPKATAEPAAAKEASAAEHGEKSPPAEKAAAGEKAGKADKAESGKAEGGHGGEKNTAALAKLLVNVSGTLGTRYLSASLTLVGRNPELKALIERNDAQLRDATSSTLGSKTITDLEKPGARNLIRAELISVCNNILGNGTVSEIYFSEFAIQ